MFIFGVFPICMGMNRCFYLCDYNSIGVPHMHGDEPVNDKPQDAGFCVFPICMGMNRLQRHRQTGSTSVPHMHGDEPQRI